MARRQGPTDVRLIRPDEGGAWGESVALPFLNPIANETDRKRAEHWKPHLDVERSWAAEDRGHFVGNAATAARQITLPGGPDGLCPEIGFTAVTAVGVHPTHRRQGLLRRLMAAMLDDARRRGEVIAGLTASESAIYGRFGFGWAVTGCKVSIDTRHSAFAVPAPDVDIDLLLGEAASKVVPAAFDRGRRRSPGQVNRTEAVWADTFADREEDRGGASARVWAICDGGVAGWRAEEVSSPNEDAWGRLLVRDLLAETPEIEAALWRFLLDIDLVREVVASPRPVDDPFRHRLVDPRAVRTLRASDSLWLRILDTAAALTARGYLREGRLVLDVAAPAATPTGPDGRDGPDPAAGRWTLDAGPEGSTCRPATSGEASDLFLGVAELSMLLAGEVRATTLAGAGRIREERPGALLVADALFAAARPPHCLTGF